MAADAGCGKKGGYDGYSKCHYHSTNHITAIRSLRSVLNVFEISYMRTKNLKHMVML